MCYVLPHIGVEFYLARGGGGGGGGAGYIYRYWYVELGRGWETLQTTCICTYISIEGIHDYVNIPERRFLWDSILRIDGLFCLKMAL